MTRSTAKWTTAIAATALLAMPAAGWAQEPSASTPRQSTAKAAATPENTQQGLAQEHLRRAKAALNDIPAASLTGTVKTRITELKRHLSALEQSAGASSGASASATRGKANWATDVAAIDRILTEVLGAEGATGAGQPTPTPTGTSGSSAATSPRTTTRSKPMAAVALDEITRAKLQEVRTHMTAVAAALSGTGAAPSTPDAPDASPTPSPTPAPSPSSPAATPQAATPPAATPSTPAPAAAPSSPAPTEPAQPASPQPASPQPGAQPSAAATPTPASHVDPEAVKRHLTAARESLSQLTQLPAAAQLTGDARTQVSQLISNFNELITTTTDWRGAYGKVQANLTALIGDQRTDESPATPAPGAAGAVGTSGTVTVDPTIRTKLVEFRTHLLEFEKAAGGGGSTSATSKESSSEAAPAAAAPTPTTTTPTTASSEVTPTAPVATSGSTAATPTPTGTTGSTPAPSAAAASPPDPESAQSAAAQSSRTPQAAKGPGEAMRHIEAIEAILNGTAAASGSSANRATAPAALDRAQIEQIRTHLAELRRALENR